MLGGGTNVGLRSPPLPRALLFPIVGAIVVPIFGTEPTRPWTDDAMSD